MFLKTKGWNFIGRLEWVIIFNLSDENKSSQNVKKKEIKNHWLDITNNILI